MLRTNGRRTLKLAKSLNKAGIEAWTPQHVTKRRMPRSKTLREETGPLMPSFVFVAARHLPELYAVLTMPISPHPAFTVFQHAGRVPVIADPSLAALRAQEERLRLAARKSSRRAVTVGETVRPSEGAFAGLSAVVERVRGQRVFLVFSNGLRAQIEAWRLPDGSVEKAPPALGMAA